MAEPVVKIENLSKRFGGEGSKPALNSVSGNLYGGEVTGLVGPDGAGKTTLIRLIVDLLEPDEGKITVLGMNSVEESDRIHEITGYMPQKFGLYEDLCVIENLKLYADLRGVIGRERDAAFSRLLEFTDLSRFTSRLAGDLSGGMKQKLGLACALLSRPKLLLLDEPSVGVDPISRRELWKMVQELVGEGMAVIWSTAYLDEAEKCDHVLLLSQGDLLHDGTPTELTDRVKGRVFQIQGIQTNRRAVLSKALKHKGVIDGVIRASHVRLVIAENEEPPPIDTLEAGSGAKLVPVDPWFEDAFIDSLGAVTTGESLLAESMDYRETHDKAVIEARGLTKQFGDFVAVRDNTFEIHRGEIFGLLGPNGAGKSTTFKMMCGLLQPTKGESFVNGVSLVKAAPEARARIGYMAQKFSLYGNLSVLQNLNFFAGVYGIARKKKRALIDRMIDIFDLAPLLHQTADSLPLGFKQRLALSCSVMHEPDVLFLDEPTSGVDPLTRREFWTHINGMVEKGVTVMVTTHFMDEAEYCDRIGLIYRGINIATGTPDELKDSVRDEHMPEPTLEEAFIALVQQSEVQGQEAA